MSRGNWITTRAPRRVRKLLLPALLSAMPSGCRVAPARPPDPPPAATGARSPVAKADAPSGIYALIDWNGTPSAATWENPSVDGVVIRTYWRDLNPRNNVDAWEYLDAQFAAAARAKKKLRLMIAPGFYAPDYVLWDPSVQKATFGVPHGPLSGTQRPLPLPWDETYLTKWFGFVDRLAARYRDHLAFAYVSATGPNSHNGEVSLPREPSDMKQWERLGSARRIEADLLGAWRKTIDHFCRAFEGKHFTLAIISKSLPLRVEMDTQRNYAAALASYGAKACRHTFGLQSNGLDGRPLSVDAEPLPQWELVASYAGKILTGFQTRAPRNLFCRKSGRDCGSTKQEIFAQTLRNGLSRNVSFLELYEVDIADAELAPELADAHARLVGRR